LSVFLAISLVVLAVLAIVGFGPSIAERARRHVPKRRPVQERIPAYDPGRERRAEARARELLRSVVSEDEYRMYIELGFIAVNGSEGDAGYGYLLYPHRPILAFDTRTGQLLNEYCVGFPDRSEPEPSQRLPDADDVLAKWISLRAGERELISVANMHVPGRQVDPGQAGRDLIRLREWRARRVAAAA
jgi:hypothetical protein